MTKNPGREGRPYRRFRLHILERDGWICQMPTCKGLTTPGWYSRTIWRSAPSSHRLSGTLDHIVALMHGGAPLDPSNARASHLTCNSSAGATIGNRARGRTRHMSSVPRIQP